jgi:alpha-D-ribose 1-methylphosphonate 5-triphosphate synthase subunit PhnI
MGYVAVKGSQEAVDAARRLAAPTGEKSTVDHVLAHLPLAVDEIQAEAGLYEPRLAATALTQARGDASEAAFLLRAYRSTLPRRPAARARSADLRPQRRISSAFRNLPGGQLLGATNDYGLRLLDISAAGGAEGRAAALRRPEPADPDLPERPVPAGRRPAAAPDRSPPHLRAPGRLPKVVDHLRAEGLVAPLPTEAPPAAEDITRVALRFPAARSARLQALARGQSGAMTAFAYANLRGYGPMHPTLGELRVGALPLTIAHPRTGAPVEVGEIVVTEAEALGHKPDEDGHTVGMGYGCVLGRGERKAIAMAVLDAVLSGVDDDLPFRNPLADEELVLSHVDPIEAAGFVEHLKLPHEVTFASDLDRIESIRNAS